VKQALLWKRILNGGILADAAMNQPNKQVEYAIIKSPIIVMPTIFDDPNPEKTLVYENQKVSIPFDSFWIEWQHESSNFRFGCLAKKKSDKNGFILHCAFFGAIDGTPVVFSHYRKQRIGLDGKLVMGCFPIVAGQRVQQNMDKQALLDQCDAIASFLLDALILLDCKNISLGPKPQEEKQAIRATKRYGGNPDDYRYYVLNIRPPGAKFDYPSEELGIMPEHVCRGHFSEYGPEYNKGLLFGKYSGRFYIPSHVRGNKKNGVIEKDYSVSEAFSC
jgi:hypothetical protein